MARSEGVNQLAAFGGPKTRATPYPSRASIGPEEKAAVDALFDRAIASGHFPIYDGDEETAYCEEFAAYMDGGERSGPALPGPRCEAGWPGPVPPGPPALRQDRRQLHAATGRRADHRARYTQRGHKRNFSTGVIFAFMPLPSIMRNQCWTRR